jgi:hypothetical protein
MWTANGDGAGRTELPFVLGKAEGHSALVRDGAKAKAKRIRHAGVCVRLGVGDCGKRSRNREYERASDRAHANLRMTDFLG